MLDILGRYWAVTGELARDAERLFNVEGFAGLRRLVSLRAEVQARSSGTAGARRGGAVAVLPMLGLMTQRGGVIDCAETFSTAAFVDELRATVADQGVQAVVIDADTPGGEVYGGAEAAAAIRDLRASKPIVFSANGRVGSMGYWLAAQGTELIVTPSGEVGSIGIYGAHIDQSKKDEAGGEKVTVVSAGPYKAERSPHGPLTDEARAAMQADVDRYYDLFVRDVARGRGVSVDTIRSGFGQGRMVGAKAAVEQGMANSIGTIEDAIRRAATLAGEQRRANASVAQAQVIRTRLELD